MPSDLALRPILAAQAFVVTREQALAAGVTRRGIDHRIHLGLWQRLLSGIYLVSPQPPTRLQMQMAALLHAGPQSALDDVDACAAVGITAVSPMRERVFVVVPSDAPARTRGFVHVRRTDRNFTVFRAGALRIADLPTALVAMSRRVGSEQQVLAAFSEAVQRGTVRLDDLARAHEAGPPRGKRAAGNALADLGAGVRSAPEGGFRHLAIACPILPPLLYNPRLRLPTGRIVVPDALAVTAGLVHETNGRGPHAREDLFESMQERHDGMTAAGLIVLHNSPRRIRTNGRAVIDEFLQCFVANEGRGLPPGVVLLDD
jgi:hypothetical protein